MVAVSMCGSGGSADVNFGVIEKKPHTVVFKIGAKLPEKPGFLQDARQNTACRRKFSLKRKKNFCGNTISFYF
ncbi:MAG: hypothetical protein DYG98_00765 [Haliscomenobacteraceae bacterium CHB4]|nr:hypothetical protein [Haliscomenobacteraceae bacterium CHB4]